MSRRKPDQPIPIEVILEPGENLICHNHTKNYIITINQVRLERAPPMQPIQLNVHRLDLKDAWTFYTARKLANGKPAPTKPAA